MDMRLDGGVDDSVKTSMRIASQEFRYNPHMLLGGKPSSEASLLMDTLDSSAGVSQAVGPVTPAANVTPTLKRRWQEHDLDLTDAAVQGGDTAGTFQEGLHDVQGDVQGGAVQEGLQDVQGVDQAQSLHEVEQDPQLELQPITLEYFKGNVKNGHVVYMGVKHHVWYYKTLHTTYWLAPGYRTIMLRVNHNNSMNNVKEYMLWYMSQEMRLSMVNPLLTFEGRPVDRNELFEYKSGSMFLLHEQEVPEELRRHKGRLYECLKCGKACNAKKNFEKLCNNNTQHSFLFPDATPGSWGSNLDRRQRTYGCPSELDGVGPTWTGGQQPGPQAVPGSVQAGDQVQALQGLQAVQGLQPVQVGEQAVQGDLQGVAQAVQGVYQAR